MNDRRESSKRYYVKNKEKILARDKKRRIDNLALFKEKDKQYALKNKEKIKIRQREFYLKNQEKYKKKAKEYYYNNREECIKNASEYGMKRIKVDIQYKILKNLRTRLYRAIKNNFKIGSAVKDLGISISEFKLYIESKWKPGMTWNNWSRTGWHIDHITPLSSFDLTNKKEIEKACHYTNLQPLWASENLEKGSKP